MQIEQEKTAFDFEIFKNQAIADMKAGKSLIGKEGVFRGVTSNGMKSYSKQLPLSQHLPFSNI